MIGKKIFAAVAMMLVVTTGAVVGLAIQSQGTENEVEDWFVDEIGTADLETEVSHVEPFHRVEASYERIFNFGEHPEEYVFRWNTDLDGQHLYRQEEVVEAEEDQDVYTFETLHMQKVPEHIPGGLYETELTVHAVYEDGTEVEIANDSHTTGFEGLNDDGYNENVELDTEIKLADPYHSVQATYTELVSFGETPEQYVFEWETHLDGEFHYSDELEVEAEENEHSVSTVHMPVVPDSIPEGEYETEMTVHAVYEDGTVEEVGTGTDAIYFEGFEK